MSLVYKNKTAEAFIFRTNAIRNEDEEKTNKIFWLTFQTAT